ncbi:MAG: DUF3891 family protein [Acidobacteriaceae bacterium]
MLRLESETGWWLITHPDHAHLAGAFAEKWGNDQFLPPEPRKQVLHAIYSHDDGWAVRDANPQITRQGKPSAFSVELVGKYSAFEEIDLVDYLAVRERAVRLIAAEDPYAAILISMHTYNLLTERADRSTIAPEQLPLLDEFLDKQRKLQQDLHMEVVEGKNFDPEEVSAARIMDHFRLLQASDNLSLLSCVNYAQPATLLHPLPLRSGGTSEVKVESIGERSFRLSPYPFVEPLLTFIVPARHVTGKVFRSAEELQEKYFAAAPQKLDVTISS